MPIPGSSQRLLILTTDASTMDVPLTRSPDFDDVVVGSSPLMVMQAIYLSRSGRHVCLAERSANLGGNWQAAHLEGGDPVEVACHLIEVFPGVYNLLEEYSGVPFVALDKQPIRVTRDGIKVAYFSRLLMLASGARLAVGWVRAHLEGVLGRADRNRILNFRTKLSSYIDYQLPAFFGPSVMKGPRDGFADFMTQLYARARDAGVIFMTMEVADMRLGADQLWEITGADGTRIVAEGVHVTTSTNLRKSAPGHITAGPISVVHRKSVAVDIARTQVLASHTYVAFWADPHIARIARIDQPGAPQPKLRFLIEFHDSDLDALGNWQDIVRQKMEHSGTIAPGSDIEIAGQVDCTFTEKVNQLPSGRVDHNLWGYYSSGNLAAGMAAWHRSKQSKSPL